MFIVLFFILTLIQFLNVPKRYKIMALIHTCILDIYLICSLKFAFILFHISFLMKDKLPKNSEMGSPFTFYANFSRMLGFLSGRS